MIFVTTTVMVMVMMMMEIMVVMRMMLVIMMMMTSHDTKPTLCMRIAGRGSSEELRPLVLDGTSTTGGQLGRPRVLSHCHLCFTGRA